VPGLITLNLCFCIQYNMRVTQCIPVCPGREMSTHYFSSSGGTCTDLTESVLGHVMPNLYFCIRCIRGMKRRCTIFHARVGECGLQKKCAETHYTKLVFLHLVGHAGHVVHSGVSWAQNIDALYFILGWDWYGFHKNHVGTRYAELMFLHLVGSAGHVVHSCMSRV
jgi:hypothetical protein